MASVIFKLADGEVGTTDGSANPADKTGVAWVLRFGGLMALVSTCYGRRRHGSSTTDMEQVGALISRKVPPTKTEKVSWPSYFSPWN